MPDPEQDGKEQRREQLRHDFADALAVARLSRRAWAEREGVTYTHLYHVVTGRRESDRLEARIADFVARTLTPEVRRELARIRREQSQHETAAA